MGKTVNLKINRQLLIVAILSAIGALKWLIKRTRGCGFVRIHKTTFLSCLASYKSVGP